MFATSTQDDDVPATGEPVRASGRLGYAAPILAEDSVAVHGTVGANMTATDPHFYGRGSEAVTAGVPVREHGASVKPVPRQPRTKDLIAELHAINAQIHQIMFQVERAVSRLATSG
jgi:hypothetical protein